MSRVLVTGATGFVGRELCSFLASADYTVRAAMRVDSLAPAAAVEKVIVGDIGGSTDWRAALNGVDSIVHAAARAHVLRDADGAHFYEEINTNGTRRLAEAAAGAGVRRFVYLSSIKVNGERTTTKPFTSFDAPNPEDVYGKSKWLAEIALADVANRTGLEVVIVRPPLVYGPEVRANFMRLLQVIHRGWPLPLGLVNNRRSLISIWNLCDLLIRVLSHRGTAAGTWLAADAEALSTPELIRRIAQVMKRPARLVTVPVVMLKAVGAMLGKQAEVNRLCGSLEIDIAPTRDHFDWHPPMSVDESIDRTVRWFLVSGVRG